jgi:hypothetical protein
MFGGGCIKEYSSLQKTRNLNNNFAHKPLGVSSVSNAGNNAGYIYDYYRQQGKTKAEEHEKYRKLKKKIDKLEKKNHLIKPKK